MRVAERTLASHNLQNLYFTRFRWLNKEGLLFNFTKSEEFLTGLERKLNFKHTVTCAW